MTKLKEHSREICYDMIIMIAIIIVNMIIMTRWCSFWTSSPSPGRRRWTWRSGWPWSVWKKKRKKRKRKKGKMIGLSWALTMKCHHHYIVMIGPNFITIKVIFMMGWLGNTIVHFNFNYYRRSLWCWLGGNWAWAGLWSTQWGGSQVREIAVVDKKLGLFVSFGIFSIFAHLLKGARSRPNEDLFGSI